MGECLTMALAIYLTFIVVFYGLTEVYSQGIMGLAAYILSLAVCLAIEIRLLFQVFR
jgi:hypothetical protein